jgi:hypothetical protein
MKAFALAPTSHKCEAPLPAVDVFVGVAEPAAIVDGLGESCPPLTEAKLPPDMLHWNSIAAFGRWILRHQGVDSSGQPSAVPRDRAAPPRLPISSRGASWRLR